MWRNLHVARQKFIFLHSGFEWALKYWYNQMHENFVVDEQWSNSFRQHRLVSYWIEQIDEQQVIFWL